MLLDPCARLATFRDRLAPIHEPGNGYIFLQPVTREKPLLRVEAAFGVRAPAAIPELARLVVGGDVETRRAASEALAEIQDSAAVAPLIAALDDADREVRYHAVVGMAKVTGQAEWGPSPPGFMADEGKYIQHWKAWSKKR